MATVIRNNSIPQNGTKFYGPERTKQAEAIKKVLQRTNIFQDGEYNFTNKNLKGDVWMTTLSRDFLSAVPDLGYRSQVSQINQFDHHFNMEHAKEKIPESTYKLSSTKGDFDKKNAEKAKILECNRVVNWPDMAPQYRRQVATGETEYRSIGLMNEGLKGPEFPRINAAKLEKPLNVETQGAQKNTHVLLGTEDAGYLSENCRMYGRATSATRREGLDYLAGEVSDVMEKSREMKKEGTTSHVFRAGDYNGIAGDFTSTNTIGYGPRTKPVGLNEVKKTVRFGDLSTDSPKSSQGGDGTGNKLIEYARQTVVPRVFSDAKQERSYQENVHFQFGSDTETMATVYNKDFVSGSSGLRPPMVKETPSANNIIQFDPEFGPTGSTSAQVDFSYQPALPNKIVAFGMKNDVTDNAILAEDVTRHAQDRQSSLAHDNYRGPPSTFKAMAPRRATRAHWDYLRTDPALPYTASNKENSEATDNFFGAFMYGSSACERRHQSKTQCKERVAEGKSTHFTIGDNSLPVKATETKLQFTGLPKNDQGVPPAGKIEKISKEKFAHLDASKNTQDMFANDAYKPSMGEPVTRWCGYQRSNIEPAFDLSVMKSDFKHVANRRFTDTQQRRIEQCDRLPKHWSNSHFFHMDNTGNDNFVSTAMRDYVQPEFMPGPKRLAAL